MKIVIVSHYFPPEIGAPQARLGDLARYWAEAGEDVTVLTGMPNHPTGVVAPGYRRKARLEEKVDGYRVVRTWLFATPNEGLVKKTLGHLSFMVSSVVLGARRAGPADVVVVSSPTFFAIFSAWFIARWRRAHFVVEVRDLWPAIFVELGILRNRWLIRVLEALELAAYRASDAVVVVSEGFEANVVDRGIDPAKVHVVRNGVDLDAFVPVAADPSVKRSLGATGSETLVLYLGAHGISHGLETVALAAAKLVGEPIHFAFVGEGAAKRRLAERVAELELANVTMLDGVPHERVPELLAAADICLVPLRDVPLFSSFIPSKIFEYFAAGKAVVGSVRGEPSAILSAGGAVVVDPEDALALADAVKSLAGDPGRRAAMGVQARRYVAANFDRRQLAERYRRILGELISR